jgi:hypothetical protein
MRAHIRELLAPLAMIFGAVIFYFGRALLPGQTIYANDMEFAYATNALTATELERGALALWHPYASSGIPLFTWAPLFYPPQLLVAFLAPREYAFAWAYIFHFILAGIGLYLFLRQLGARQLGATLGAVAYTFSASIILRVFAGHFMYVYAAAWIPLIFYFTEKIFHARTFRYLALGGGAIGMQLLCAVTQIGLFTLLMLGIYFLVRLFAVWREAGARRVFDPVVRGGGMILIGLGIGAIYWMPAHASVASSVRAGGLDFATAAQGSLPPTHLVNLLLPDLFGTDLDQNYWGYFFGAISQIESGLYVGLIPLLAALFAVRQFKSPAVMSLCVVGVSALLFALGRFTPLYQLIYHLVPGMSAFRYPARMSVLVCFALAALAGLGMNALENHIGDLQTRRRLAGGLLGFGITGLICALMMHLASEQIRALAEMFARIVYANAAGARTRPVEYAIGIAQLATRDLAAQFILPGAILVFGAGVLMIWHRAARWARVALGLLIALDLGVHTWVYLIVIPPSEMLTATQKKMLTFPRALPEAGRVYAEGALVPMNFGNVAGFANVSSGFPQVLKHYHDLIYFGSNASTDPTLDLAIFKQFNARAFQLLNVTTAFTLAPIDAPGWRERARAPVEILAYNRAVSDYPIPQTATAYVYENASPLPRVFIVYDARVIADDAAALAAIYHADFDPARQVILDQPVGALGPAPITASVQMQSYAPTRLELTVTTDAPGIVVLSEIYAPGWSARVDDHPAPILRANYALRGIYVSAGAHRVELVYLPPRLIEGLAVTGLTLVVILLGVGVERYREKRGI